MMNPLTTASPVQRRRAVAFIGWLLLTVSLWTPLATLLMYLEGCSIMPFEAVMPFAGALFGIIGRILTHYRSRNQMSWLVAFSGAAFINLAFGQYTNCGLEDPQTFPFFVISKIAELIGGFLLVIPIFVLIPATFPDGRLPLNREGRWIRFFLAAAILSSAVSILAPGPLGNEITGFIDVPNPLGLNLAVLRVLKTPADYGLPMFVIAATILAFVLFIRKFRGASGTARQQFKVFATFLTTIVLVHIIGYELLGSIFYPDIFMHWSYEAILILSFGGFPVVIGLVVFRYRLYDIDLIIRRTLSYALLTGLLAMVFFGGVVLIQWLFQGLAGSTDSPLVTVISTLAIAALFNPLRIRTQEFIDRRFYRAKYDAEQALLTFSQTTRDEVDLDRLSSSLLKVVHDTVRPETISLLLRRKDA